MKFLWTILFHFSSCFIKCIFPCIYRLFGTFHSSFRSVFVHHVPFKCHKICHKNCHNEKSYCLVRTTAFWFYPIFTIPSVLLISFCTLTSSTWLYRSIVMVMSACPIMYCRLLTSTPLSAALVQNVCRNICALIWGSRKGSLCSLPGMGLYLPAASSYCNSPISGCL